MKHTFELEPEEIAVPVRAEFRVRFEHDSERGGYRVTCKNLPELAAHGATLGAARADARRKITEVLERRADRGEPIPRLIYRPPAKYR